MLPKNIITVGMTENVFKDNVHLCKVFSIEQDGKIFWIHPACILPVV
jgi:hypothetical protein